MSTKLLNFGFSYRKKKIHGGIGNKKHRKLVCGTHR